MREFVLTSVVGHTYRIELNRPDCGNLVTTEMVFALTDAVSRLPADAKLRVLSGEFEGRTCARPSRRTPDAMRRGGPGEG